MEAREIKIDKENKFLNRIWNVLLSEHVESLSEFGARRIPWSFVQVPFLTDGGMDMMTYSTVWFGRWGQIGPDLSCGVAAI